MLKRFTGLHRSPSTSRSLPQRSRSLTDCIETSPRRKRQSSDTRCACLPVAAAEISDGKWRARSALKQGSRKLRCCRAAPPIGPRLVHDRFARRAVRRPRGSAPQRGAGRDHRRGSACTGSRILAAVDVSQVHGRDAEGAMAELALDDDQRYAFASHLDGVGVPEFVGRKGGVARQPRRPRAAARSVPRRATGGVRVGLVARAEQRTDPGAWGEGQAESEVAPKPTHPCSSGHRTAVMRREYRDPPPICPIPAAGSHSALSCDDRRDAVDRHALRNQAGR